MSVNKGRAGAKLFNMGLPELSEAAGPRDEGAEKNRRTSENCIAVLPQAKHCMYQLIAGWPYNQGV